MALFTWFVVVVCGLLGLANLRRVRRSLNVLLEQRGREYVLPPDPPQFVILVPLLREQAVVRELWRRMARLDYPAAAVRIVFVTTRREISAPGRPTTHEVVRAILSQSSDPRFAVVQCDGSDRCKADQLNFALRELKLDSAVDDVFIGVYDADSSPDPRVLRFVAANASGGARGFQQIPLYSLNLAAIPRTARGYLLLTRPMHNALFALSVELPEMQRQVANMSRSQRSLRRITRSWMSHAIGHGEFFRSSLLRELGGFRPPSCDTQFGHAMAFAGIPLHPIPLLDLGETPHSVRVLLEQGVVWFNSMNTFPLTFDHIRRLRPANHSWPASVWMMLRLLNSNLAWATYPLVFAGTMVASLVRGDVTLLFAATIALGAYVSPMALLTDRFAALAAVADGGETAVRLTGRDRLAIVLMFPIEKLFACISPWLFGYRRAKAWLSGSSFEMRKTERIATATTGVAPPSDSRPMGSSAPTETGNL